MEASMATDMERRLAGRAGSLYVAFLATTSTERTTFVAAQLYQRTRHRQSLQLRAHSSLRQRQREVPQIRPGELGPSRYQEQNNQATLFGI